MARMSLLLPEDLSDIVDGLRVFETRDPFEAWLTAIKTPTPIGSFSDLERCEDAVVLECTEGSNSEVVFDGVLRVDGSFSGGIRSYKGKLVMTERGRLEADVEVGTALIDGYVKGNITATERVVLGDHACVVGNVTTPAISMSASAILEGELLSRAAVKEAIADQVAPSFVTPRPHKVGAGTRLLKRWLSRSESDSHNARRGSVIN
jgi:cytoskeletal protein CcmA (bactofilin family)